MLLYFENDISSIQYTTACKNDFVKGVDCILLLNNRQQQVTKTKTYKKYGIIYLVKFYIILRNIALPRRRDV